MRRLYFILGLFYCSELCAQTDTLISIYRQLEGDGKIIEITTRDIYRPQESIYVESFSVKRREILSHRDTLTSVSHYLIKEYLEWEDYEEDYLRLETKYLVKQRRLQAVAANAYCLNGQRIYQTPEEHGFQRYFCNGNLSFRSDSCEFFEDDFIPFGHTQVFYRDGTVKREGMLTRVGPHGFHTQLSYKIGEWKIYDVDGNFLKTEEWTYDGLVNEK